MNLYRAIVRACSVHNYQKKSSEWNVRFGVEGRKKTVGELSIREYPRGFQKHPRVWKTIHGTQNAAIIIPWICHSCMRKVHDKIMRVKVADWVWRNSHTVFLKPPALSSRMLSFHSYLSNKIVRVYGLSSAEAHCCNLHSPTCLLGPRHVFISAYCVEKSRLPEEKGILSIKHITCINNLRAGNHPHQVRALQHQQTASLAHSLHQDRRSRLHLWLPF